MNVLITVSQVPSEFGYFSCSYNSLIEFNLAKTSYFLMMEVLSKSKILAYISKTINKTR